MRQIRDSCRKLDMGEQNGVQMALIQPIPLRADSRRPEKKKKKENRRTLPRVGERGTQYRRAQVSEDKPLEVGQIARRVSPENLGFRKTA